MKIIAVKRHNGLLIASIIWLVCIVAALLGAFFRSGNLDVLWPYALAGAGPAIVGILLAPVIRREWAQILVILAWLSLAIVACLAIAFVPMAILFLCAPAAAALFEKEKVIEAMILAAVFAALIYYAGQSGYLLSEPIATASQSDWGQKAGIAATIAFLVAAMYGAADKANRHSTATAIRHAHMPAQNGGELPGTYLRISPNNRIGQASERVLNLLQLDSNDVEDKAASRLFDEGPQRTVFLELIEKARRSRGEETAMFTILTETGLAKYLEFTATSNAQDDVFVYISDRTDESERLVALHDAHADAVRTTEDKALFFAGVSHELRTPLNAIIGFSDMMRSRMFGPLPGKYAEYADLIHDSGQHMLDLIGDVLDLSKVEAGKYELSYTSFDVADVVRSTVKMIRPTADAAEVQLDVEIDQGRDQIVEADRKAIRQILLNLLSNAIKFTPKGGRIVMRSAIVGNELNLTVADNGSGMDIEELGRASDAYVQTQSGRETESRGSGLGLTLVKSLTELHDGRFMLASQIDKGTTADIYIPLKRTEND